MKTRVLIFGLMALLLAGWLAWSYAWPHTVLSEGPLTLSEAQASCPIALPRSAVNIRLATYRQKTDATTYIKFSAPLEDCQSLARQLLPGVAPQTLKVVATRPDDLPPQEISKHFTLAELAWFDAYSVTDGLRYAGPDGPVVVIAMPTDKVPMATFYYRQGD